MGTGTRILERTRQMRDDMIERGTEAVYIAAWKANLALSMEECRLLFCAAVDAIGIDAMLENYRSVTGENQAIDK